MSEKCLVESLKSLLKEQKFAVLASIHEDVPYTNLVGFAATEDLKYIFFVTSVATRKYSYLITSQKASMMIDNRSNNESDFKDAMAVNATGKVMEAEKTDDIKNVYLAKNPYLHDFLLSPSSALMRMEVKSYIVASKFQNVVKIDMS
ncbi:pyridoxamine 5'-phosphate oxidase family protein [Methanolobus halotolerans]|uniref:Pyridoxamine 5'-phosphate oxidase n=1 Tax=Methanolobus halotolerans TaxID=2052935 RepID=A0A4E0QQ33_9EURY|nr:pyridoxamine 5'-phosphate oxidase family protein [Methanolobus halotolerans]TGC06938.1 pyridoxamine 5'-phosphate oxidase [Methanolobus halotolerans]